MTSASKSFWDLWANARRRRMYDLDRDWNADVDIANEIDEVMNTKSSGGSKLRMRSGALTVVTAD